MGKATNSLSKFGKFDVKICLCQGNVVQAVFNGDRNMKSYFVYIGQSLLRGEEGCITIGLSSDGVRREYNKVMIIQHVLPCKSLRHARAVEKEGHIFLDKQLERANCIHSINSIHSTYSICSIYSICRVDEVLADLRERISGG